MLDLSTLASSVWLMEPTRLHAMLADMSRRLESGRWPSAKDLSEGRKLATSSLRKANGKVATLSVCGPICHRYQTMSWFYGGASCEDIGLALDSLLENPACAAILLDIDSPGGSAEGIEELGDKIFQGREQKPIYAISNALCASAALWLGTQATKCYCTPSGAMGSLGAYLAHIDYSKALEEDGLKVTLVSAGKYKTERNPYEPLSLEAQESMQEDVDAIYTEFVKAVARGRATGADDVRKNFGQGRLLTADEALQCGMCDGVMSMGDLLERLGAPHPRATRLDNREYMEQLRRRHEFARLTSGVGGPRLYAHSHEMADAEDEPAWEDVDQDKLPDKAFADPDGRTYAHHWVQAPDGDDEDGRHTGGKLLLHRGGLAKAEDMAEARGASEEVKAHLADHREAVETKDREDEEDEDEGDE